MPFLLEDTSTLDLLSGLKTSQNLQRLPHANDETTAVVGLKDWANALYDGGRKCRWVGNVGRMHFTTGEGRVVLER